jgi:predicted thioesterase
MPLRRMDRERTRIPMPDTMALLKIGLAGESQLTVAEQHTAPHVGSGHVHVLATPVMVNMMEAAALQAVDGLLPDGYQTVGTRLDIGHFAATPVGMRVTARAEVTGIEGPRDQVSPVRRRRKRTDRQRNARAHRDQRRPLRSADTGQARQQSG